MIPAAAGAGVRRFILLSDFATGPHTHSMADHCRAAVRVSGGLPDEILVPIL